MIKCLKLIVVFLGVCLLTSCSDSSGSTVSRNLNNPAFNLTSPNSTGNSAASAPTLSTVTEVAFEGRIVSNVVSDSESRHYVLSKNGAARQKSRLNKSIKLLNSK